MSPLFLKDGKLLIRNAKLATSARCCCGEFEYAIFFCNSNASFDPNFNVLLNDNLIGQHLAQAEERIIDGELWVTDLDIALDLFSCENCEDCANDPPWLPENFPIPPRVPGQLGDDLTPFALCKDCTTGPLPLGVEGRAIRILEFDRDLIVDGNNTLKFINPPGNNPDRPQTYARIWVFKIAKNPLKVDSILLSTAIDSVNNLPNQIYILNFIK